MAPENDSNVNNTSCEVIATTRTKQNFRKLCATPLKDNSLNIIIETSTRLQMDEDNASTNASYALLMRVKPYLSKDLFQSYTLTLTHPINGRLKKCHHKSKKKFTRSRTGILFFLEKQLYCEVLEFQFISVHADNDVETTVPWKTVENETNAKSAIEHRIVQIIQEQSVRPPSSTNTINEEPKQNRKKLATFVKLFSTSTLRKMILPA